MSQSSDPFPMQSEEALRLSTSVSDPDGSDWNKMGTETEVIVNDEHGDDSNSDGIDTLVNKKAPKGASSDDIYDEVDQPNSSHRYSHETDGEEYFDKPLPSTTTTLSRLTTKISNVWLDIHKNLYGDKLPPSELLRVLCLASTLFFVIGGYWLLRSLKDPVLTTLCGVTAIPKAKFMSVFVVLGVVSIYNRLLDNPNLTKHSLFYIFGTFYFALFTTVSLLLTHPTIGLPNKIPNTNRILGWVSYCGIESFGSVMVSLFWSFVNSNSNLETAKASYGLLVATAQIGSIFGPTIVNVYAETWGVAKCYFVGAISMLCLQFTMFIYVKTYGTDETRETSSEKPKRKKGAGVLEGLLLFVKHNYIKGIFAISCLFMVEVTIVDYTMKVLARDYFVTMHPCTPNSSCWDNEKNEAIGMSDQATTAFTTFMGLFGQSTNAFSFLLSFFGTSAIIRSLGLRITLLLFPTLCLAVIIVVRLYPTLYVVFAAMMILKANSYALNNPTKEMLYQPTSSAVRYKAKSWIDIFGARGSKGIGSLVVTVFSDSTESLISNGSLVGMAVASFLIWNARYMGLAFDSYVKSGYIVGAECDSDGEGNEAEVQNEGNDTSCAIHEDDELDDIPNNKEVEEEKVSKSANVHMV